MMKEKKKIQSTCIQGANILCWNHANQQSQNNQNVLPGKKKNNQPVHFHLIKNITNNQPVQKKGEGEKSVGL